MLKAEATLLSYIKKRKLLAISKDTGIEYMTLWYVAKGKRTVTYNVMRELKKYIDVNDWFTEE